MTDEGNGEDTASAAAATAGTEPAHSLGASQRDPAFRRRARSGVFAFLVPTFAISFAVEAWMIADGRPIGEQIGPVFLLMWTPTLVSLPLRLIRREGIVDVSFRLGSLSPWILAFIYPFFVGGIAYGVAWLSGLATFAPPDLAMLGLAAQPPWVRFVAIIVLNGGIGTFISCVTAAGEEIGWRGYLLTRLMDSGWPRPVLISGLVWGLWHVPLIVTGQYASGGSAWLAVPIFVLNITVAAYLFAALRLASGSVWPAILLHGSWNAIIQGVFDTSTADVNLWVGESGLLVTAVNLLLVAWFVRRPFGWRRHPREAPGPAIEMRRL